MNHPEHLWQHAAAAPGSSPGGHAADNTPPEGTGLPPGTGYGFHGPGPHHHGMPWPGMPWPGMPHWPGYPPPGFGMGPPPYGYGAYGAPGYHGAPLGPSHAAPPPGPAPAGAEQAGFGATMGGLADQAGLGMFKDFFSLGDGEFWKGAVVGAAVVMLLTNENLREALLGGATKAAEAVKSGMDNLAGSDTEPGATDGDDATDADAATQTQTEDSSR